MRRFVFALLACLCAALSAQAQPEEVIHPDLRGEALREAVLRDYYPRTWYSYARARDTLFARIDAQGGRLTGVYTGFTVELAPGADPTTDAFEKGINTEHTWPQSLGAEEEPARSDMHHLFPVKANVNSSRSNHPYDEIPDAETDAWYYLDESRSTPPESAAGLWSEKDNDHPDPRFEGRFEPREDHKGNAARAIFYFAAIYPERADPTFFEVQKEVLLAWHRLDPADSLERARTGAIAAHQGTPNPFVLDSSLVRRAFFESGEMPVLFVARYTFDDNDGCPTTDDGPSSGTGPATFGDFQREGVVCESAAGAFNSSGWPVAAGFDESAYIGFTAAPWVDAAMDLRGKTLSFALRRSGTGPQHVALRYRVGPDRTGPGGAFTTLGEFELLDTDPHRFVVALPDTATSEVVALRWYAWGATGERGTLRIDDVELEFSSVQVGVARSELPEDFALWPIYPNPFNPRATIPFTLARPAEVLIEVYDVLGRRVATLTHGTYMAGRREVTWSAGSVPSGMYLVRMRAGGEVRSQPVMLLK